MTWISDNNVPTPHAAEGMLTAVCEVPLPGKETSAIRVERPPTETKTTQKISLIHPGRAMAGPIVNN